MSIVVREGADTPYYHGSDQRVEAMRATIAEMRSNAAQDGHLFEETRSIIAHAETSVEADALLQALEINIDQ